MQNVDPKQYICITVLQVQKSPRDVCQDVCGHHANIMYTVCVQIHNSIYYRSIIIKTNVKQSVFCAIYIYSIQRSALSCLFFVRGIAF